MSRGVFSRGFGLTFLGKHVSMSGLRPLAVPLSERMAPIPGMLVKPTSLAIPMLACLPREVTYSRNAVVTWVILASMAPAPYANRLGLGRA